jgi:hypothetical protein
MATYNIIETTDAIALDVILFFSIWYIYLLLVGEYLRIAIYYIKDFMKRYQGIHRLFSYPGY